MHSFYISTFINDSTVNCDCTYNFTRMGISDVKDIFENVWNIGKVSDIDYIHNKSRDQSIQNDYGVIVYIDEQNLFRGSSYIIDLLEHNEYTKNKFQIYGDDIENGSGPYLEIELCTSDMLYGMSSKYNK